MIRQSRLLIIANNNRHVSGRAGDSDRISAAALVIMESGRVLYDININSRPQHLYQVAEVVAVLVYLQPV